MDQRILLAVLLSLLAEMGYTSNSAQAADLRGANTDRVKVAQAADATAKPADKPADTKAAPAAKPKDTDNPAFTASLNKGIDLYNKNKPEEALAEFNKALAINQNNTAVQNWIGATYQKMQKHKEAAEVYEKLLEIDDTYAAAHNNLGFSYQQLGENEKAENEYKRALEIDPSFIDTRFNLACILQVEKKNDEAITQFEETLKADPKKTDCYLHIGDIARELKDYDKAMTFYNKALPEAKKNEKTNPQGLADVYVDIAVIDKDKGDKDKCKDGLEKALDLDPGNYLAHLNMGILAYESKDFQGCLNSLGKALERNPYDAAVHFWLGRYYFSLDSLKNSIKQFTDCLKCDASEHKFPECEEWLEKAKKKQATF